ncbi:DUF305 domain-containing protein [Streptomyces sp. IBSNAI002]|uniref:DUF305 domain-containing protein n=1 Tax=Streptomyces sp. IBSNAI002 TaxID=3457500 RepID=UPI003FCF714E
MTTAAAALLAAGLVTGRATAGGASADHTAVSGSSPEAGFARDMSIHHAQAVEMSFIVRSRTDDPDISTLSYDIITTQSNQRGMMLDALQRWDLPVHSGAAPMAWMGHGGHFEQRDGALMPGMATNTELARLKAAPAGEAEVLYLRLMVRHHQAGMDMAQGYVDRSVDPSLGWLARSMVAGQREDISLMKSMLVKRGAGPDS